MKHFAKVCALSLGALLAVASFASCGGEPPKEDDDPTKEEQPLPTPDAQAPVFASGDATLDLDARLGTVPAVVSESLFGVFLEDINYAGYLLDDNLLYNGGFEAGSVGWTRKNATLAVKQQGVLNEHSVYHNTVLGTDVAPNYAEVEAQAGGTVYNGGLSRAGLTVAVEEGADYVFSAFVKASTATKLTISVIDGSGSDPATYATGDVEVKQNESWVKYKTTIKATESGTDLRVALTFETAGTYGLDAVSFETTDATVGIKQYVYDAIEELAPKFIRFPGGCIIEGNGALGPDTRVVYDWKNSVGAVQTGTNAGDDDIPAFTYPLDEDGVVTEKTTYGEWATRTPNADLWGGYQIGYEMEYGVGFLEYFELCESLNAAAVPVLNCGLSCQGGGASDPKALNGRHNKKIEDYIRDAVDLIEFAKGDTSTKWGALRAKMGHEKPFKMDYLGIGNEQFGDYYSKYYEKFLESEDFRNALEEYGVKVIVGNGMFRSNCQNPDTDTEGTAQHAAKGYVANPDAAVHRVCDYGVHDQHYYVNYTFLFENAHLYDNYLREADNPDEYYEVFVGEYSANAGDGSGKDIYNASPAPVDARAGYPLTPNSLITALSEAAAMTGMERNGEVVKLAAYAPMFGKALTGETPNAGGDEAVNQWDVDMMYYTSTEIVRTANYYVQKMFMHNQGKAVLRFAELTYEDGVDTVTLPADGNATPVTAERLYLSATQGEDGSLIVKLVNPSSESVKLNTSVKNAVSRGFAYVTELAGEMKAMNTLQGEAVKPVESTIGWTGQQFGYEVKPYSLTVFRIVVQ